MVDPVNNEARRMNTLQMLLDGASQQWQRERASTQMTLGQLIDVLSKLDDDAKVPALTHPHSYRGYYCDLAFEQDDMRGMDAGYLLLVCRNAMGQVFEGYKGGDYMMGASTPVWIASYGNTGEKLVEFGEGVIRTVPDEW